MDPWIGVAISILGILIGVGFSIYSQMRANKFRVALEAVAALIWTSNASIHRRAYAKGGDLNERIIELKILSANQKKEIIALYRSLELKYVDVRRLPHEEMQKNDKSDDS